MATWTQTPFPSATWVIEEAQVRTFDPHVFDRSPVFDTGSSGGIWDTIAFPATEWTEAP